MTLRDRRALRAGPLTAVLEGGDLRYLCCGPTEVVRRLHGAVRDATWDTVPGRLTDFIVDQGADAFSIAYTSTHQAGPVDFAWRATIEANADGDVAFTFDGEARRAFVKNRIGLCALLPLGPWSGRRVHVTTTTGATRDVELPTDVAIEQPVAGLHDLGTLRAELLPGLDVHLAFEGDTFEIEDQRNWIDASFKAYGTPLSLPRPVTIDAGARVWQRITLGVRDRRGSGRRAKAADIKAPPTAVRVRRADGSARPCPPVGIGLGRLDATPNAVPKLIALLHQLRPAHVRLVVGPTPAEARECLTRYAAAAHDGGAPPIELVLETPGPTAATHHLLEAVAEAWPTGVRCARVLAQAEDQPTTTAAALDAARRLATRLPQADTAGLCGSRSDLYEWHLFPPPAGDGAFWGMNPQVHAFDDTSLAETPAAAPLQAETMAARHPAALRVVSPITLERRGRPSPALRAAPLAAAWTGAMLARLLVTEVAALTFGDDLAHLVDDQGTLTPMAAVLRDMLVPADQAHPAPSATTDPDRVARRVLPLVTDDDWLAAVALQSGAGSVLWMANPSPRTSYRVDVQEVCVTGPGVVDVAPCHLARLDADGIGPW